MMYARLVLPLALAARARACEGPCIRDVTHAFVANYSAPVQHVFAGVAASIAARLPAHSAALAARLVAPLRDAYDAAAPAAMQRAIFPGYFHGKCQVDGVDPAGCPNPDCPVVCGTPGSMVHFYGVLQQLAFNATAARLAALCAPASPPYRALETALLHALRTEAAPRRRARRASRLAPPHPRPHAGAPPAARGLHTRRAVSEAQARAHLASVCRGMVPSLAQACGGRTALPGCSWEKEMKAFILSFP